MKTFKDDQNYNSGDVACSKEFLTFYLDLLRDKILDMIIELYKNYDKKMSKEETTKKTAMLGKANKENSSLLNVSLLINEEESVDSKTLNDIVQKTVQYKDDKALQKQATKLENLYAKKEKTPERPRSSLVALSIATANT